MGTRLRLYSEKEDEINDFLNKFYGKNQELKNKLVWEKDFKNPIDLVDIIGVFIDNDYNINMWINLDDDVFINITKNNADEIIKYIYERFPW